MQDIEELKNLVKREGAEGLLKLIKDQRNYDWIGIYVRKGNELVLAIEVGAPANHRVIEIGEGICGLAAKEKRTIVVEDVSKEKNYLACFPSTKSEIVIPILRGDEVLGEIDVDSDTMNAFNVTDEEILSAAAEALSELWDEINIKARLVYISTRDIIIGTWGFQTDQ